MASMELNKVEGWKEKRWEVVEFGVLQNLLKYLLKHISDKTSGILTILSTVLISISDTFSDLIVAFTLFVNGYNTWGCIVVAVDYVPSWILVSHNFLSSKWRNTNAVKEKLCSIGFVVFSPFASTFFHLRWLCQFEQANSDVFDFLHHNSRLMQMLNGSFESPIQIVILLVLWGTKKLESPVSMETCFSDSQNRNICLGILPGILSLTFSVLSLIKCSLDISESHVWHEKTTVFIYSLCNYAFRIPSIALAIMYFNEWSLILFILIVIINIILIARLDPQKRKDFSVVSSVVIATISPFVASDQANLYQRMDINTGKAQENSLNEDRRKLSAKTSLLISPLVIVCDVVLLVMLKYYSDFKFNQDIILEKQLTIKLLEMVLLPLGILVMLTNFMYYLVITPKKKGRGKYHFKMFCQQFILFWILVGILASIVMSTISIYSTKGS
jgi:hypothetical protein